MYKKIVWLKEAYTHPYVGNKAKNLSLMLNSGYPVPDGFVISSELYEKYVSGINIFDMEISEPFEKIKGKAEKMREAILKLDFDEEDINDIFFNYKQLDCSVAVRSSCIEEDMEKMSFAGQYDSFLNIREDELINAIKLCWASLYSSRSIVYRMKKGLDLYKMRTAVIIQEYINASLSGVIFTQNPITGSQELIIEYTTGNCEDIVKGSIFPKRLVVPKTETFYISDERLQDVAKIALSIENFFNSPQDIEWVLDKEKNLKIIQSRPLLIMDI